MTTATIRAERAASTIPDPAARPTLKAEEAFALIGIGRTVGYEQIRQGTFPVRVLRLGRLIKIPTAPLLDWLGLAEETRGVPAEPRLQATIPTIPAAAPPEATAETVQGYADELALAEADLAARGIPVDAILRRMVGRPDGTLDLERLARLAVVGALTATVHLFDHHENPTWPTP
jgi:predicted DNA-binding transcriptional regulator AlpA